MTSLLRRILPALALSACTGAGPSPVKSAMHAGQPGYQLAVQSVACWIGGAWADAEGVPPPQRRAATERRCRDVLRRAFGEDAARYQAMRQIEPQLVEELSHKAGADAGADKDVVERLVHLVADAQREARAARHVANQLRRDQLNDPTEPNQLTPEELAAVAPLRSHAALEALLKADLGALTEDAHALGILVAMDRMETVRRLPRELKAYALEGPGRVIFGLTPPEVPHDLSQPLPRGAWLSFLSDAAQAAGHPVPAELSKPRDRGMLAWHGVLAGLADRLRAADPLLSKSAAATLKQVLAGVAKRLDEDYAQAQRAAKAAAARPG